MSAPLFSVVVPSYNRAADLERTLRGYERQAGAPPFEVVVVDDGSTDATGALLAGFRTDRFALRSARQENGGPARARNRALALASGRIVLFTGDDIEPSSELLARHAAHHEREGDPKVAILGRIAWPERLATTATMRHVDGRGAQQFSFHYMEDGTVYDYRHLYTSNVSVDRAFLLSERGPFDESFPHAAFEDAELGLRLARRGLRIRYRTDALAWHWHRYEAPGFFARQRRCGEMAALLIEREPETAKVLGLAALERDRRRSFLVAKLGSGRLPALAEALDAEEARALEAARALDPGDDDTAFPLLYALFNYGYAAGLADGRYPRQVARRTRAARFARDVAPHLPAS
jgi:GT2 family glycosyltransferase